MSEARARGWLVNRVKEGKAGWGWGMIQEWVGPYLEIWIIGSHSLE